MQFVFDFSDPAALENGVAGGKGRNLARLSQAGLPVPDGFVVAPEAYSAFVAQAGDMESRLRSLPLEDAAALERACETLATGLAALPVPEAVAAAITRRLAAYPERAAFSVRSSATTEDLGGAAFAGQHDTFLNCAGADEILRCVKACWLSLWAGRAVAYRHKAGFDLSDARMAVVVQRMVFSEVAGVGFCLNPLTGALDEQAVDANYGLGESVVGGEHAIDHWVLAKADGRVKEAAIAVKTEQIVSGESGTRVIPVAAETRARPCLAESQLAELSTLMREVERLYGYPQDIEWGLADGRLWLLQARPITRIPPRWTRDESAERFPTPITPLSWDLVEEGFHRSLNHSFQLMGLPPYHGKWFALFDNYVYGNQNAVEVYADGTANAFQVESLEELAAALPVWRERYSWVQELPVAWSRDLDRYLLSIGRLMAEPLEGRPVGELWSFVLRVKDLGTEYFLPNIAISITQRTLYKLIFGLLRASVGKEAAPALFDSLLAYCETKTGFVNRELRRLAGDILRHPALAERLRAQDGRRFLAEGGFAEVPEIAAAFGRFLENHGHREVEFDPYHPTWVEAPELVVENLKVMLDGSHDDVGEKERTLKVTMGEAEWHWVSGLPEDLRYGAQELLRLARAYTSLDDIEHYQTTRLTLPFRRGLKALGAELQRRGVVEEPMDVFFAPYAELDAAVRADSGPAWGQLSELVAREKNAYRRSLTRTPEWILGEEETPAESASGALSGLPGSPGRATGPVFKVLSVDDFGAFPQGAVLVARTTNPAWTPLFYRACAVVTESGGPLSHGAVTAREVGLPAVMSVRGALEILQSGQTVTVDGGAGRVLVDS